MTGRTTPPHSPPASHLPCLAGRRNPSEKPGRGRLCRLGFKGIEFQHRCSQCTTTLTWQLPNDSKLECVCVCACVVERMHVYLSSRGTTRHDERYSLPIRSPLPPFISSSCSQTFVVLLPSLFVPLCSDVGWSNGKALVTKTVLEFGSL